MENKKPTVVKKRYLEVKKRTFEIKAFSESFAIPVRAKNGSVGYDLTIPEDTIIPAKSRCRVPLGFAINLPRGVEAKIEPRSGLSITGMIGFGIRKVSRKLFGFIPWKSKKLYGKWHFDADVMVGKIDPNYTDQVNVIIRNNDSAFKIEAGTRIAQMTFYDVGSPFFKVVDVLSCKSRGGGFCSSGTRRISTKAQEVEAAPAPHVSSEEEIEDFLPPDTE